DIHMLSIPHPTDVVSIFEETLNEIDERSFELKENATEYFKKTLQVLRKRTEESESSEYYDYIGVQLDYNKNKNITSNVLIDSITKAKTMIDNFDLPTYRSKDLNPSTDILVDKIKSYKQQVKSIEQLIMSGYASETSKVTKATTQELLMIVDKLYSVKTNNTDVIKRTNFESGKLIEGIDYDGSKIRAIRTDERDFKELQNTVVDENVNPKYLKLQKLNNYNSIDELYSQFFVIHQMDAINHHPGFEWLHYLKLNLSFPVTVSISIDNVPNEMLLKRLSNVQLEMKDQTDHASTGSNFSDPTMQKTGEVIQMESMFKKTGHPSHSTNFIIKVTGNSP